MCLCVCVICTHAGNKRRKGRGAGAENAEPAANAAAADAAAADDDHDGEAGVLVESESETADTWASWAAGLAVLCKGLGAAVQLGQCCGADVAGIVEDDMLCLLYETSPNDAARYAAVYRSTQSSLLRCCSRVQHCVSVCMLS